MMTNKAYWEAIAENESELCSAKTMDEIVAMHNALNPANLGVSLGYIEYDETEHREKPLHVYRVYMTKGNQLTFMDCPVCGVNGVLHLLYEGLDQVIAEWHE